MTILQDPNIELALGLTRDEGGVLVNARSIIELEAPPDPYWNNVEWCFEEGRLECYSGIRDSSQMRFSRGTSTHSQYRKGEKQIDVGPNLSGWRVYLPPGTLNFSANESLTIELEMRNNDNRPGTGPGAATEGFDWPPIFSNPVADYADGATLSCANLSPYNGALLLRKWYSSMQSAQGFQYTQNEWFNLAIVIDRTANEIRWYKDGKLMGMPQSPIPFGALHFQHDNYNFMMIGNMPYDIGVSYIMNQYTPNGGGVSMRRARFTRGIARYSGASYTVPKNYLPVRVSRFDPFWDKTVFYFDGKITPDSFTDLTGRHTVVAEGTASVANGKTSGLFNDDYFRILENLGDFVFAPGEDFCIEVVYNNRPRPDDPTAENSVYGLNLGPENSTAANMMWISHAGAGSLDPATTGAISVRLGAGGGIYLFTTESPALFMWDIFHPNLPELPHYLTIARKDNVIYANLNGANLHGGVDDPAGITANADHEFALQTTVRGMYVGRGTMAPTNGPLTHIRALRITKGSSRGVGPNTWTGLPMEWGINLNV